MTPAERARCLRNLDKLNESERVRISINRCTDVAASVAILALFINGMLLERTDLVTTCFVLPCVAWFAIQYAGVRVVDKYLKHVMANLEKDPEQPQ